VQPDGRVPYGIVGHGTLMPTRQLNSSYDLWVLLLAREYVLGTRDTAFLDEVLPTYPLYGPTAGKDTVRYRVEPPETIRRYNSEPHAPGSSPHFESLVCNEQFQSLSAL
jgi:hypothetical protein